MKKGLFIVLCAMLMLSVSYSQSIDLEKIADIPKAKPFDFGGNISVNGIYYNGSNASRNPFTFFLQGSASVSLFQQITLPFSFSFTNQGVNYSYPTLPNRFSLHPTYKGYTLHLGEVNTSFSGYTMSGVPIFGVGFDANEIVPDFPLKVSLVFGRMQKASEYNPKTPEIAPAYQRLGYGGKLLYSKNRYKIGLTVFGATDRANSLKSSLDSLSIRPQQNIVTSLEGSVEVIKNLIVSAEYAASAICQDLRDENKNSGGGNFLKFMYKPSGYTDYFNAVKGGVSYSFFKTSIGVNYERIDPGYKTLGTYYSNQDLERIALDISQSLWQDKISVSGSFGFEHDNLKKVKAEKNKQFAYALGVNMNFSERFQANANYSNFTSHANIRSQFEDINNTSILPVIDTINYMQTSQNANLTLNYLIQKSDTRTQKVGVNFSFQDAYNHNDGEHETSTSTQFYNMGANYGLSFPTLKLNISASYNTSINMMPNETGVTTGPTLSASYTAFKSLTTGLILGCNFLTSNGKTQNSTYNIRFNAAYRLLKRHSFNLSVTEQFRKRINTKMVSDLTLTVGYVFNFK